MLESLDELVCIEIAARRHSKNACNGSKQSVQGCSNIRHVHQIDRQVTSIGAAKVSQ